MIYAKPAEMRGPRRRRRRMGPSQPGHLPKEAKLRELLTCHRPVRLLLATVATSVVFVVMSLGNVQTVYAGTKRHQRGTVGEMRRSPCLLPLLPMTNEDQKAHAGKFGGHLRESKVYSQLCHHYWWRGVRHGCFVQLKLRTFTSSARAA